MTKEERKQDFIKQLAHFLVDNQAGKSIFLQMESMREDNNLMPKLATEWANLRTASMLRGYPNFDEAVESLTEMLS
jgi:hypothetical protein